MPLTVEDLCEVVSLRTVPQSPEASVKKYSLPDKKRTKIITKKIERSAKKSSSVCSICVELLCKRNFHSQQHQQQQQQVIKDNDNKKVLTREVPLYDDNGHLLGYLAEGTVLKGPYCKKSKEPFLEGAPVISEMPLTVRDLCRKVSLSAVPQSPTASVKKVSCPQRKSTKTITKKNGESAKTTKNLCVCCKGVFKSEQQRRQQKPQPQLQKQQQKLQQQPQQKFQQKQSQIKSKNKVLTREVPLYDENCHLLGYLPEGTVIKEPYCEKSKEPFLEIVNTKVNGANNCPLECKKALKKGICEIAFPRWVIQGQYEMATRAM